MAYNPIEDYGVIGDLNTACHVCRNGSIDFFCFPDFDSPSVFARMLDAEKGGYFSIAPEFDVGRHNQLYLPDTNILLTRFLSEDGILEITDFMPIAARNEVSRIIRTVRAVRGEIPVKMECFPAPDYARFRPEVILSDNNRSAGFAGGDYRLRLQSTREMSKKDGRAEAHFTLEEGKCACFMFTCGQCEEVPFEEKTLFDLQEETAKYWRDWVSQVNYGGRWPEVVRRSALALKLMTSGKHGSIAAAPTFSLPETIGGARNWDYRYCWIRDSAFTVYAFLRLNFKEEASAYMDWIEKRFRDCGDDGSLQLMYGLDGGTELVEKELEHLEGYEGSRPVRIGNAAKDQLQLDIYGELLDSVYLADKYVHKISYDSWMNVTRTVNYVCENWQKPDAGIWEFRGGYKEFLHSRLMNWVAVDRAVRMAQKESLPAPFSRWFDVRGEIYHDIFDNFWDEELQAFVQYKGAKTVDASALLMPLVKFISPLDPRWLSTMDEIKKQLVSDSLVKRYNVERAGFEALDGSEEGSFTMCSFWYIECLARAGRREEARLLFDKMIGYANHLGLYSEELGHDGRHLGNFPQAFTHLALISAASALERF
jgi:GH15 family glucan-1,4-alpha-glucosidase